MRSAVCTDVKFNRDAITQPGRIEDVLYENITIDEPEQWPIWIGPAQQSDTTNLCYANPCSECWPNIPWATCNGVPMRQIKNLVLRNIEIRDPKYSTGVLLASNMFPMEFRISTFAEPKIW